DVVDETDEFANKTELAGLTIVCSMYWILFFIYWFFFFSSRRRHTRSKRDWSSDVCSSDLFANGAPNLTVDVPALQHLAEERKLPIGGKDFKTGQTMMKTVLAPAFKARMLGLAGWYSTNILGNRDGEVLDDPESFKTKEESKL